MKKFFIIFFMLIFFTACSEKSQQVDLEYNDGEYVAQSIKDDWGGNLVLTITIKDGKITDCKQENLDVNGNEKSDDYGKKDGKINNPGLYKIAQNAVKLSREYPDMLVDTQDINQVEMISGATVSYKCFVDATNKAFEQAKK